MDEEERDFRKEQAQEKYIENAIDSLENYGSCGIYNGGLKLDMVDVLQSIIETDDLTPNARRRVINVAYAMCLHGDMAPLFDQRIEKIVRESVERDV